MEEIAASSSSSLLLAIRHAPSSRSESPSDMNLLRSLSIFSGEVSVFHAPCPILRSHFSSITRKSNLLSVLFDDLLLRRHQTLKLSRSASLCFREILAVLNRFKALLAECSSRSRMRLILYSDALANDFHELILDLSTLLDILPLPDLHLSDDGRDVVRLLRLQCRRSTSAVDPSVSSLRREILAVISDIEREIVPDRRRLASIFRRLGLDDSHSCRLEIQRLEQEIMAGSSSSEKWTAAMISLVGVVRYAKCVLHGASTPRSDPPLGKLNFACFDSGGVPPDFRCPISLDVMRDPVVVASGQTFDRESITRWIQSGHTTCPSTGQALKHTNLIPNRVLLNLISRFCREQNIPFALSGAGVEPAASASFENKAALEAARMTATFLVQKLSSSPSDEVSNRIVHELRQLAKTQSENRAFIAEAGAVPLLLPFLASTDPCLQLNAVTTLLNLSILEANKSRIMHAAGSVAAVVHVISSGETWQAKENAATLVLSLSSVHSYRRRIGRNRSVAAELVKLVLAGPPSTKKDAMVAILGLAGDRKNVQALVEEGAVEASLEALCAEEAVEAATAVVAAAAKRGGGVAAAKMGGAVGKLVGVLRRGTDAARENAAAALVVLCRQPGGDAAAEVANMPGIEKVIREILMGSGSERGRQKAAALGRICRRWAESAEEADRPAIR